MSDQHAIRQNIERIVYERFKFIFKKDVKIRFQTIEFDKKHKSFYHINNL